MDNSVSKHGDEKIISQIISLIKPYKSWVILSVISAIAISACDVISVALIRKLIDNVLNSNSKLIFEIIILTIIIVSIGVIASYLMPYASGRLGGYAIRDLRSNIVLHLDNVKVPIRDKMRTGDTTSRLNNDISMVGQFIGNLFNYIYMPLVVVVTFIYLLTIQWKLVILSSISIPIALVLSNKLSKPMGKFNEEYYKYFGEANGLMQDAIVGISVLKAFNLQEVFYTKCRQKLTKALEIYNNKINVRGTILMPIMFMVYELPYVLCATYGGYLAVKGELTASSLVAFMLLLRFLVGPTSQLPGLVMDARSATGAGKRLFELLELQTERTSGSKFNNGKEEFDIEFENVTFGYEEKQDILKDLSFKLKKGNSVALVGPSGCGKSTIMNLICGFYKVSKGTIKLYGKEIEDWNLASLRDQLAFVSQDTYLYPGSIEENIKFGRQNATHEEVIAAAQKANAHDFIMKLQNEYDTQVGERGVKLSGGQKQRIAIARAILKNASILLLDEPTSALDTQSELLVQQSLEKLVQNKTVLIIAHRLSTIKQADLILVIDNGSIVEKGTHDELLSNEGLYKQLYFKQFIEQAGELSAQSKEGA